MRNDESSIATTAFTHPRQVAAVAPDRPALIMADTGERLTYGALVARADQAARLFESLGVKAGDTVAFLVENQIRYPELLWAAKNSELHYVAVSTQLNVPDLAYILTDSGARLLVTSAAKATLVREAVAELKNPPVLLCIGDAEPPFLDYEAMLSSHSAVPLPRRARGASMLYSSGTTGRPKGVKVTLGNERPDEPPLRHHLFVREFGLSGQTVFINPGPFYHAGPGRFMMATQRLGGTVIGYQRFDAETVLNDIGRYGATHGFFVPTMFIRMLRLPDRVRTAADLSTLQCAVHAAAPCPVDIKRAMIAWWGPVIGEFYSGTEGAGHSFISAQEWLERPGSVGRPAQGCRIKIVDDTGEPRAPGQIGRVMMSNGRRFIYHNDPEKTAAAFDADGFASLGDIGYLDEEGYLYLTDRESHMIISGGVNIYPQEAENVLAGHVAVADVGVIGIPHPDLGEEVKAVVKPVRMPEDPETLAAELLAYCQSRLSKIKCPRSIDFVEELPRNEAGKLVKHQLKMRYWADRPSLI